MSLTDTTARNAKPKDRPYKLTDEKGLYLLVKSVNKYWRLDYRFIGTRKTLAIGVYPDVSLKDARDRRDEARKLLASGVDPAAARKAEKALQADRVEKHLCSRGAGVVRQVRADMGCESFQQDHPTPRARRVPLDRCAAHSRSHLTHSKAIVLYGKEALGLVEVEGQSFVHIDRAEGTHSGLCPRDAKEGGEQFCRSFPVVGWNYRVV